MAVAPTLTDLDYAFQYAEDVVRKQICEAHPDKYKWVPSPITRYPCPEGLTCETGTCVFTKNGCLQKSELPFYDCDRKSVKCNTSPSGTCEICDYAITTGQNSVGPFSTNAPPGCVAGDIKYADYVEHPYPYTDGVQCEDSTNCATGMQCFNNLCTKPCDTTADCPLNMVCGTNSKDNALYKRCYTPNETTTQEGTCAPVRYDPPPYQVQMFDSNNQIITGPVPCSTDFDCSVAPGVGELCSRNPDELAYGYCYNPYPNLYLEWRDKYQKWSNEDPVEDVCVLSLPFPKQWCEMPWIRQGSNVDDPTLSLKDQIKLAWKTKAHPPFWYNSNDGTCHITKTYCTANLKNGGFSSNYGNNVDYWLGTVCNKSSDNKEIIEGYDCCNSIESSVGQFFLGRTITTDILEVLGGDIEGVAERWNNYYQRYCDLTPDVAGISPNCLPNNFIKIVDVISDSKLKYNISRIGDINKQIHLYSWTWSPAANELYGLHGAAEGLLSSELPAHMVHVDEYGFDHVHVPTELSHFFHNNL